MAMMISKFHKIIQSKVVWTAFAILISVAFVGVYTGSRTGGENRIDPSKQLAGRLFGEDVTNGEYREAYRDVYIMYIMMTGRPIDVTEEVDQLISKAAWQRLATLKKAATMGLTATDVQVIEMIKQQPIFMNRETGLYDANQYNAFVSSFLPRQGMDSKAFENMIRRNVILEKAANAASQGALVTDDEIKKAFHLQNDKLTVEYATLPRSLAGTPEVTEEDAKAYFEQNKPRYRMPANAIVKYVAFDVAAYTNDVEVTDEMISQLYENNKQRFIKPAAEDAPAEAEPEYKPLEEVKGEIVEEATTLLARKKAYDMADGFVGDLSVESVTFEAAAEKSGLQVIDNIRSFAETDRVEGIDPYAPFARTAFTLEPGSSTHYYSDPIVGRDTVYVQAIVKFLPAWDPDFETVKEEATTDASLAAAEKAYIEKSEEVHAAVEAALKEETSFTNALATFNIEIQTTEPFNTTTMLEERFGREIMGATLQFDPGTLVDLISTSEDFIIAYVAAKEPADEAATLPALRSQIEQGIRNDKAAVLVQSWQDAVLKEAQLEDLTVKEAASDES